MSRLGTSWRKKEHEYDKKIAKRYYYGYEAMLKKLWKLKQLGKTEEYNKLKAEYDANKNAKANKKVAKIYSDVAEKMDSPKLRKESEYFTRRANDNKLKKTKRIKLVDVTSDTINRGKLLLSRLIKRK